MFYVYVLKSCNYDEIYVGSTNDLRRRFKEHNEGKEISTRRYMPWRLVAYEAYAHEYDARDREKKLKSHGNAMKMLKKRITKSLQDEPKSSAGFTIIELLIAIGLVMAILVMSILIGFDAIGRSTVHGERDLVVSLLQSARAQAIANVNEEKHGIKVENDKIILFEGDDSSANPASHREVERSSDIMASGVTEIVFDQLSGNAPGCSGVTGCTITLSGAGQTAVIDINEVGRIDW